MGPDLGRVLNAFQNCFGKAPQPNTGRSVSAGSASPLISSMPHRTPEHPKHPQYRTAGPIAKDEHLAKLLRQPQERVTQLEEEARAQKQQVAVNVDASAGHRKAFVVGLAPHNVVQHMNAFYTNLEQWAAAVSTPPFIGGLESNLRRLKGIAPLLDSVIDHNTAAAAAWYLHGASAGEDQPPPPPPAVFQGRNKHLARFLLMHLATERLLLVLEQYGKWGRAGVNELHAKGLGALEQYRRLELELSMMDACFGDAAIAKPGNPVASTAAKLLAQWHEASYNMLAAAPISDPVFTSLAAVTLSAICTDLVPGYQGDPGTAMLAAQAVREAVLADTLRVVVGPDFSFHSTRSVVAYASTAQLPAEDAYEMVRDFTLPVPDTAGAALLSMCPRLVRTHDGVAYNKERVLVLQGGKAAAEPCGVVPAGGGADIEMGDSA